MIKGRVQDSTENQTFSSFQANLLNGQSTIAARDTLSNTGTFTLKNLYPGNYTLQIDIPGYKLVVKPISLIATDSEYDLGTIILTKYVIVLDTVVIKSAPPAVRYQRDTTEYYADSFKVEVNANVEELLTKLPGIYISGEGRIIANGKEITKVLVDNEPFFSGDPKIAIRNIPADIVEHIQIYNATSDMKNLTGVEDGQRSRTLNIKIKRDKKRGAFGQATIGGGMKDIYGLGITYNNFKDKRQISFIAQSSNSSEPIPDSSIPLNAANGISTSSGSGVNFKDDYGKNTKLNGAYTFTNQQTKSIQNIFSKNIFPEDSSTVHTLQGSTIKNSNTHKINLNVSSKLGKLTHVIIRPHIQIDLHDSNNMQIGELSAERYSAKKIYSNHHKSELLGEDFTTDNNLTVVHLLKKKSSSVVYNANIRRSATKNTEHNNSVNYLMFPYQRIFQLSQLKNTTELTKSIFSEISVSEPIGKDQIITISHIYRNIKSQSKINVFGQNLEHNEYSYIDSLQTNNATTNLNNNEIVLKYQIAKGKYSLFISNGLNFQNFKTSNSLADKKTNTNYLNLTPKVNVEYRISDHSVLQLIYNLATQQPTQNQLQDVVITSDSLFIYKGNSSLKQTMTNNISLNIRKNFPSNASTLLADISGSIVDNDIQYSTSILNNGTQITSPINVKGSYNLNSTLDYTIPIRQSNLQLNLSSNIIRNKAMLNDKLINTSNANIRSRISLSTKVSNSFDLNLASNTSYNYINYLTNASVKTNFLVQDISAAIKYYPKSIFHITGKTHIMYNSGLTSDQPRLIPILSMNLGQYLLKNKLFETRLSVHDLLNKSAVTTTTVSQNTVQSINGNSRGRYIMLSFVYNYRKFAKPANPD